MIDIFCTCYKKNVYTDKITTISLLQLIKNKKDVKKKTVVGVYRKTTEERGALISIIKAFKALNKPTQITVYTDSKFIVDAINKEILNEWSKEKFKSIRNGDLWKIINNLISQHKTEFVWMKPTSDEIKNLKKLAEELSDDCKTQIDKVYEEKIKDKTAKPSKK